MFRSLNFRQNEIKRSEITMGCLLSNAVSFNICCLKIFGMLFSLPGVPHSLSVVLESGMHATALQSSKQNN